jgi:hypothetical protein
VPETPEPVRLTTIEEPVEELLATESAPASAPALVGSNCTLRVADWPDARVKGKAAPETVNPAPLMVTPLTVTVAVPVEVRVSDCVAGELRFTLPKAIVDALTLRVGTEAATPAPVKLTLIELPVDESLARVSAPAAAPAVVGSNLMLRVADWLGERVKGKVAPETVNPAPLMAALLTATAAVPVEVSVSDWVAGELRLTLPKAIVFTLTLRVGAEAATPVPVKLTTVEVPVEESLVRVSEPEAAPADAGLNCTVRVAVWLGDSCKGKDAPETANPDPVTVAELMESGSVPVEVSVSDSFAVVLTETLPNPRLVLLTANLELPSL